MRISDPGSLTFKEEEIPNRSQPIRFPAGQNTSEQISRSKYAESSSIKQTDRDYGLSKNTIAANKLANNRKSFSRSIYNNLINNYGGAGSSPKILYSNAEARAIEAEEGGVKIIDLNQYPFNKADNTLTRKTQQNIGVVLTKRPNSAVTVEVSLSKNPDLKALTPTLTFTSENWNIPQKVKLKGCTSSDISLTFRAKANAQGGFKGTEKDEITLLYKQEKFCSFEPKNTLKTSKHEPTKSNSSSELSLLEFQSPFFMILRAFLQPFFFALGIAKAINITISPQHQEQEDGAKNTQTDNAENKFAANTFIDADPLTTISMPIIETEASANNGITETILLGTAPVTAC